MSASAEASGGGGTRRIEALSQQVVNQIAAGEVIHRPSSALKEMLENSLDAGSTSVSVLAKGGGMKLLQIHDNGHGILRDDFARVCVRFATSKLREYDDLETIDTFGFRGEALASISHVAHVTITSMTEGAPCAYRATYADGQLVPPRPGETPDPKPCAGNKGTQILVEDMFYNAQTRRAAMKGPGEEYARILQVCALLPPRPPSDTARPRTPAFFAPPPPFRILGQVVQAYAVDNAGVALACRKGGESSAELQTQRTNTTLDVLRLVHGGAVARELIPIDHVDGDLELQLSGYVSNANYSAKKLTFLLFVNKRLVESYPLRRAVEEVRYFMYSYLFHLL